MDCVIHLSFSIQSEIRVAGLAGVSPGEPGVDLVAAAVYPTHGEQRIVDRQPLDPGRHPGSVFASGRSPSGCRDPFTPGSCAGTNSVRT
jgi:hypothetical protein